MSAAVDLKGYGYAMVERYCDGQYDISIVCVMSLTRRFVSTVAAVAVIGYEHCTFTSLEALMTLVSSVNDRMFSPTVQRRGRIVLGEDPFACTRNCLSDLSDSSRRESVGHSERSCFSWRVYTQVGVTRCLRSRASLEPIFRPVVHDVRLLPFVRTIVS